MSKPPVTTDEALIASIEHNKKRAEAVYSRGEKIVRLIEYFVASALATAAAAALFHSPLATGYPLKIILPLLGLVSAGASLAVNICIIQILDAYSWAFLWWCVLKSGAHLKGLGNKMLLFILRVLDGLIVGALLANFIWIVVTVQGFLTATARP